MAVNAITTRRTDSALYERQALGQAAERSAWLPLRSPRQSLETAAVEADDHLVIHRDDWHRHSSGLSDQLIASRGVLGDVLGRERDTMDERNSFAAWHDCQVEDQ